MNTREHLKSYMDTASHELKELRTINWPQNRNELNSRMSSLENFLQTTIQELKHTKIG